MKPPATTLTATNEKIPFAQTYPIRFPESESHLAQNEESCEVYVDGSWVRLRLHDYSAIYQLPGLYEQLFGLQLRCGSPQQMVRMFREVLQDWPVGPSELRVLELGAGNGMVGEELRRLGVGSLVGVDILPEASDAAGRDRPYIYDDYLVADLCDPSQEDTRRILKGTPNCLVTVAALGFGDIPTDAFVTAYNLISTPGWVIFNIKETFLAAGDDTGFSGLIRKMSDHEYIQIQSYQRYKHRFSVSGQRLHYVGIVARKLRPMHQSLQRAIA